MNPLSVSAAVVGLLSAAASILKITGSAAGAPKLAHDVVSEVKEVTASLALLRPYVERLKLPCSSRASLISVDQVVICMTSCVETFSDLENPYRAWDLDPMTSGTNRLK